MLSNNAAYEILTEKLIDPQDRSVYIRTTTDIWRKVEDSWKITHMNIGLHRMTNMALRSSEEP